MALISLQRVATVSFSFARAVHGTKVELSRPVGVEVELSKQPAVWFAFTQG